MAKYGMNVRFKTHNGTTSNYFEVVLPDNIVSKIGNSNYNEEVIKAISVVLPQTVGGVDWRKQGYTVLDYSGAKKIS